MIVGDRYVVITTRYACACKACRAPVKVGDKVVWDTQERKAYCMECGLELLEDEA